MNKAKKRFKHILLKGYIFIIFDKIFEKVTKVLLFIKLKKSKFNSFVKRSRLITLPFRRYGNFQINLL